MPNNYDYEVFVIGSGSAGIDAADAAKEAGAAKIGLAESWERLGGECPNRGCVPTKAILRSVDVLQLARRAKEFGLKITKPDFDLKKVLARKQKIVDSLTGGGRLENYLKSIKVDLYHGQAKFISNNELQVGTQKFSAAKIIIATGSTTSYPPVPGLRENAVISDEVIEWTKLPKSIIIVGGGPIGSETAQFLNAFGVKVTIVEFMPHILPREDPEIAEIVQEGLRNQGVIIYPDTQTTEVKKSGKNKFEVTIQDKAGKKKKLTTQVVMAATGKKPVFGGLGIENTGVKFDKRGAPITNDYLQTDVPGIYVAGDALGKMLFTHVAHETGTVAGMNAVKGNLKKFDFRVIPRGTFTTPEVGSVGMNEKEAELAGHDIVVGKVPYSYFGKAITTGESQGLTKIIADRQTKLVLGGHIVGENAAEIIHVVTLAMQANLTYTQLAEMVYAYPTFAESIGAAAASIE